MKSTVREAVLGAGQSLGLPEPVTEAFIRLLRPCVQLCPYDDLPEELKKDARPVARAAGLPHLPEDMEAPLHLPHVVTIDCAAIPTGVLDIDFPADGHLVILAEIQDYPGGGVVIHLPAGTETVERHPDEGGDGDEDGDGEGGPEEFYEPFALYAVPGTTSPPFLREDRVAEAVDYAEGDAERARLVDKLIDEIGDVLDVRRHQGIQLGGYSRAWHNPVERRGHVSFACIPESAVSDGDGFIALISGTREQIAEHRYDELRIETEC